jgi:hypothetical protein
MKLTRVAKSGLALIVVGLLIFLSIAIWLKTVRTNVVDIPMPLRGQSATQDFTVNFNGLYTVWVRFDPTTRQPTADCLLGRPQLEVTADSDCKNIAPLLNFAWKLNYDGQNIATGSSAVIGSDLKTAHGLDADIVSFHAETGHKYTLAVQLHQDARSITIIPPRVRVDLDIFNREDLVWAGAAADYFGLLLCLIGAIMFSISLLRTKLKNRKPPAPAE